MLPRHALLYGFVLFLIVMFGTYFLFRRNGPPTVYAHPTAMVKKVVFTAAPPESIATSTQATTVVSVATPASYVRTENLNESDVHTGVLEHIKFIDARFATTTGSESPKSIDIWVYPNPGNASADAWIQKFYGDTEGNISYHTSSTDGVAGVRRIDLSNSGLHNRDDIVTALPNEKLVVISNFTDTRSDHGGYVDPQDAVFDTLLASVTFNQ